MCTEVGWEEVHTDVGGAFAEVIGGKTRSFGRDRVGGVGEGSKWGDGAEEVGEGIADGMAEAAFVGIRTREDVVAKGVEVFPARAFGVE